MRKFMIPVALLALAGCVEPHGMQAVGAADDHGYVLHEGQACTDQLCAEGAVALALYGPQGQIVPLPVATMTSLGERAAGTAALVGGLITAGWADGVSHPSPKK
jgi:hypothetical protein